MEKKVDLSKLFTEKKYSDIINILENYVSDNKKNSGLINLLGVCRLLKSPRPKKKDYLAAIGDFKKAFLKEKRTTNSLEAFRNYINTSVDLYDFDKSKKNETELSDNFQQALYYFSNDQDYYLNDELTLVAIIRIHTRLVELDKVRHYLNLLIKKQYFTPFTIRSFIYNNCFIDKWKQESFFEYGKILNNVLPIYEERKLTALNYLENEKIRIGFLSSDIRAKHSVTYFLKTILETYNFNKFEIYLYTNHKEFNNDDTTNEFKKFVFRCTNISSLDHIKAINLIRNDKINIFIDLMGITSGSRLELIKNRVAPIQISWCGYCNTSGVKEMDYIISDHNLIHEDERNLYHEKILYMPNIWNCHSGLNSKRVFGEPPCIKNNYITFGSFNNFSKVNDSVIDTWSEILKNVKNSKLILKSSTKRINYQLLNKFEKNNVLKSVEIKTFLEDFDDHLELYDGIDISLDTFPYNGVTTSFESIWKGVPVLTMKGYNFNSRCGESINKNLNLNYLIAEDRDDYVFKANELANNIDKLKTIRKKIYDEIITSPLFDKNKFNQNFFDLLENLITD